MSLRGESFYSLLVQLLFPSFLWPPYRSSILSHFYLKIYFLENVNLFQSLYLSQNILHISKFYKPAHIVWYMCFGAELQSCILWYNGAWPMPRSEKDKINSTCEKPFPSLQCPCSKSQSAGALSEWRHLYYCERGSGSILAVQGWNTLH